MRDQKKFNQQMFFKLLSLINRKTLLVCTENMYLTSSPEKVIFWLECGVLIRTNIHHFEYWSNWEKISGIPCNYKKCKIYSYWILNNNFVWEKFHRFIFVRCAYSSLNLNASFFEKKDKLVKFHTKIKDKSFHAV